MLRHQETLPWELIMNTGTSPRETTLCEFQSPLVYLFLICQQLNKTYKQIQLISKQKYLLFTSAFIMQT